MNKYQQIELAIKDAVAMARMLIPIDTGNLRYSSFKINHKSKNIWEIYIDDKVAPYAPYVNEKWTSPKWHGKQNPNEGFWQKVFEFIGEQISKTVGGQILFDYGDEE